MDKLNPHTGPALLQRIIEGDTHSFDQLFMEMYAPVFLLISRLTGDDESSRDIVSDVFLQLWEKRQSLAHVKDVKAYLYVSARNRALNHLRRIKLTEQHEQNASREIEIRSVSDSFLQTLFGTEMIRSAVCCCQRASWLNAKKVMELTLDGQNTNEIAAQLNISASAVSHQKKRAQYDCCVKNYPRHDVGGPVFIPLTGCLRKFLKISGMRSNPDSPNCLIPFNQCYMNDREEYIPDDVVLTVVRMARLAALQQTGAVISCGTGGIASTGFIKHPCSPAMVTGDG